MLAQIFSILPLTVVLAEGATVIQWDFQTSPNEWSSWGKSELFHWDSEEGNLQVTWDSSKTNSYYSVPLPRNLTIKDSFGCEFDLKLNEISSNPEKPYTFQIAVGFFHFQSSARSEFFRGTGLDATHGPRNLLEFNYFPAAGLIESTVAPTLVSKDNHVYFSDNHPLELYQGETYTFRMSYDAASRTLQSWIWQNGLPYGPAADGKLRTITLPARFTDFSLDRFGVSSYSDAEQTPPFAGSILAHGEIDNVKLTLPSVPQPRLEITSEGSAISITLPTLPGYVYYLESSDNLTDWELVGELIEGDGSSHIYKTSSSGGPIKFYRARLAVP
ncbi:MAG: hypothetical protein ACO1QB_15360 [Verrucomicrobiales bacterium]